MKDIELPEPLGYMNAGHVHELQQGRLHYGYVYPKGGIGAEDAVYTADQLRAAVEADRAQRVPDGWKLVPVEPTVEMCTVGMTPQNEREKYLAEMAAGYRREIWSTMLSAAPEAKP